MHLVHTCQLNKYKLKEKGLLHDLSHLPLSIAFVLAIIEGFGSFVAMTVTSCRKFLSISLSFLFFPKPLSPYFAAAAFCVLSGLFIHIYSKVLSSPLTPVSRCFTQSSHDVPHVYFRIEQRSLVFAGLGRILMISRCPRLRRGMESPIELLFDKSSSDTLSNITFMKRT